MKSTATTLWEDILGIATARRLRYAVAAVGLTLLVAGSVLFVAKSQTVGALLLMPGAIVLLLWAMLVPARGDDDPLARWRRKRPWLVGVGATLAASGWIVFFTLDGNAGLLLVLLGGILLAAALVGSQHDDSGGLTDGPWYGETRP